jgi:hypothetical protein
LPAAYTVAGGPMAIAVGTLTHLGRGSMCSMRICEKSH